MLLLLLLDPHFSDILLVVGVVLQELANGHIFFVIPDILQDIILVYTNFGIRLVDHRFVIEPNFLGG